MTLLNSLLGVLAISLWIALILVYNHKTLIPWLANRFARDKPLKDVGGNSLFEAPSFLPFHYDLPTSTHMPPQPPQAGDISILYENEHYVLRYYQPEKSPSSGETISGQTRQLPDWRQKFVIISFHDLGHDDYFSGAFSGVEIARALGLTWLSILPKNDSWYRLGDYKTALTYAAEWTKKCQETVLQTDPALSRPHIIAYGTSMGAYAALKYSAFLNCDAVLSLVPQWSLSDEEIKDLFADSSDESSFTSPFAAFFRPEMHHEENRMGITEADVTGHLYIAHDPYERHDRREMTCLARHIRFTDLPVCYGGHDLATQLENPDYFAMFLENYAQPDILRQKTIAFRRVNAENTVQIIVAALAHKRPDLAKKALHSQRTQENGTLDLLCRHKAELARRIARTLIEAGYGAGLSKIMKHINMKLPD